jgi:hypothetical protein
MLAHANPYDLQDCWELAVQNEEPDPRIVTIEGATGRLLAQTEADIWILMETPQRTRERDQEQERRELRRFLKRDGRFAGIARTPRRLPEGKIQRDFEGSWLEIYIVHVRTTHTKACKGCAIDLTLLVGFALPCTNDPPRSRFPHSRTK